MAIKSREEIIKGLELCSLGNKKKKMDVSCDDCPYQPYAYGEPLYKGTNCDEELMKDALEYIKTKA